MGDLAVIDEQETVLVVERELAPVVISHHQASALIAPSSHSIVIVNEQRPHVSIRDNGFTLIHAAGNQGPPGADGADGVGSSNDLEIPFAFGDATPKSLGTLSGIFIATSLVLVEAFDGTGAALSVGTMADPELLMPADANLPGESGRFEYSNAVELDGVPVFLFITPGMGASQGSGLVFLERSE